MPSQQNIAERIATLHTFMWEGIGPVAIIYKNDKDVWMFSMAGNMDSGDEREGGNMPHWVQGKYMPLERAASTAYFIGVEEALKNPTNGYLPQCVIDAFIGPEDECSS